MADRQQYGEDSFFQKLTRIFRSGPAIRRKIRGLDINKPIPSSTKLGGVAGTSYKTANNPFSVMGSYGVLDRENRFMEFAEMEYCAEVATALDLFADESCSGDEDGRCFHVMSDNPDIQRALEELFYDVTNVDFELRRWIRNLVKYGDQFLSVEVEPDQGVTSATPIHVSDIDREEEYDALDPYAVRFKLKNHGSGKILENWQVVHLRIVSNDLFLPYGTSFLEAARKVWRQLVMLEDAMLVYRLVRCLHGDSTVWTEHGYKKIKDISVGDKVYSYDPSGNLVLSHVTDWINNGKQQIWNIRSKHRSLKANAIHPVFVFDKHTGLTSYVPVNNLVPKKHQLVMPKFSSTNIPKRLQLNEQTHEWFGRLTEKGTKLYADSTFNKTKRCLEKKLAEELFYTENRIHQFLYASHNKTKGIPFNVAEEVCKQLQIPASELVRFPKGAYHLERLNLPEVVDVEFARFFGFMVGDGYLAKTMWSLGFATGLDEENNNYYAGLLKKYCSDAVFRKDKRNPHPQIGKYQVCSVYFCKLMKELGFTSSVYTKTVPDWIFTSSNEIKEAFIDGLADADGHRRTQRNTPSIEIQLCNKAILEGVKELCHQLGWNVSSKISTRTKPARSIAGNPVTPETTSYELYLTKVQTGLYEDILSVEATEEFSDVYDIRVDNDLHNFVANGCVVHNSPERRVFYIDVSGLNPNDIPNYMEQVKQAIRTNISTDRALGRTDQRFNPIDVTEDYFLPTKANSQTKIDTLAGGTHVSAVEDVEYMQKKLTAALKVPRSYLGWEDGLSSKSSLSQQDIRFSRTIQGIQKIVIAEMNQLAVLHLYAKGFDGEDLKNFELKLSNPSTIALQQKLNLLSMQFDIAGKAKESELVDMEWIQKEILKFRSDTILKIRLGQEKDAIRKKTLENLEPPKPGPEDPNNSIVDPFDPAGYGVPGSSSQPQQGPQGKEFFSQPASVNSSPIPVVGSKTEKGSLPIRPNPTPNLDKSQRRFDRVNRTGSTAIGMPNLKSLLDLGDQDPYDQEFLNRSKKESIEYSLKHDGIPFGIPGGNNTRRKLAMFETFREKNKRHVEVEIITEGREELGDDTVIVDIIENELGGS